MSIQSEYDLALFGNLTVDEVFSVKGWPVSGTSNSFESNKKTVGGIGNIIEALDGRLKIHVEGVVGADSDGEFIRNWLGLVKNVDHNLIESDKPTTKAIIFSDTEENERTSFVKWGCGKDSFTPKAVEAKWGHVSYLDLVPGIDLKEIRKTCQTLSADFCLSSPNKLPDLSIFDVLFMSETEANAYKSQLKDFNETIVCHTRSGTWVTACRVPSFLKSNHINVKGIDVLGAGDAYCAGFILNRLNGLQLAGATFAAHEEATGFLLKRKG